MDLKFQWCQYVHSPSGPNYYLLKEKMESFRTKKLPEFHNFDFKWWRDHRKKNPMSVVSMSR